MEDIGQNVDNIDTDVWVQFLYEATNLFKTMGSAMAMAFSGIFIISVSKANNFRHYI
jgi:hypothetical protein